MNGLSSRVLEIPLIRQYLARIRGFASGTGLAPLLVRSVAGTGFVRFAAVAASFLVGVQLARLLGAEGYGYYGMALAVVTMASLPAEMGIPRLVTRDVAVATAKQDDALLFGVLHWADITATRISGVMTVAILIAGFVLSRIHPSALSYAMLAGAPMISLLPLARIRGGALQGLHRIVRGQIPDVLLRPMLLSVLIFITAETGVHLTPVVAMGLSSVAALVVYLVARAWLKQVLPARPAQVTKSSKSWMGTSIPIGLTDGLRTLHSEVAVLVLGLILTPAAAGLFRIANVSSFTAATPVPILQFVAFPIVARLYAQKDARRLQRVLTLLAQMQFASVFLICLPLMIVPGQLLHLVFGAEYVATANALRILVVGQVIASAFGLNYALLNMTHNERRVTRAAAISLILNLLGVPILSFFWGLTGAAISVSATIVVYTFLIWRDARRLLGLETSIIPPRLTRLQPLSWSFSQEEPSEEGGQRFAG